jgi:methionine sulfoxide reductase heme-binding subunit
MGYPQDQVYLHPMKHPGMIQVPSSPRLLWRIHWPWNDRAGRLSALKLATFIAILVPAIWLAMQAAFGTLGSKPVTEAIHQSGDWAVRILLVSLIITPLRFIASWPGLIAVRRMLGVAVLGYASLHLALYVVEQAYDLQKVVSEIISRIYLTIGFAALMGLIALGITSTDAMIRRLGAAAWNRLHSLIYALAVLALIHFFLQSKVDVTQPVLMAGFFFWLMGFRLIRRFGYAVTALSLTLLALAAALLTALLEATWYATMTGAMASRVLAANLDFSFTIRPSWWVLLAGLAMVAISALRALSARKPTDRAARTAVASST